MKTSEIVTDSILLTTAFLWGFGFVAQRMGMDYVGPFTFNGLRFALGSLVLLPFIFCNTALRQQHNGIHKKTRLYGGLIAGFVLFAAASLQQIGIIYTTAGNAGFITGLYVILVPIILIFMGQRTNKGTWIGAFLALSGLYLLSVTSAFTINRGDMYVLLGAFFWAAHVIIIGRLSPHADSFELALLQYTACSFLSLICAFVYETITYQSIARAALPLMYGGVISVGIAYTLQVIAQKKAHPSHAAILLCMEAVFAALGGYLILAETMSVRQMSGCLLMLAGMLISQLWIYIYGKKASPRANGSIDSHP